jgi:hypothetical protein
MTVADITGVLRDHVTAFAVATGFLLILCTVVRHEYGTKGLGVMFAWLLVSVLLSAVGAWIDHAWGHWPARIYSIILNTAIVAAIVISMNRTRAAANQQTSKSSGASNAK